MKTGQQLADQILQKIAKFQPVLEEKLTGKIIEVSDGVAKISGLYGVTYMEMVEFPHGIMGVAINLEENSVGAIVLGDYLVLNEGDEVKKGAYQEKYNQLIFA